MAAMLEDTLPTTPDASPADAGESVLVARELFERMRAELQFEKTRNAALNFEVARLKRWRFGSSSESLDATTQAVLFDAILTDTLLEDIAALAAAKPAPPAPSKKRQAVRQALPANLPRIAPSPRTRTDALRLWRGVQTHRRRGQRTAGLRPGPVLRAASYPRQVRLRLLPDRPGRADAGTDDRQGHPGARPACASGRGQARRSPAAVPPDRDIRALRGAHPALEHGAMDRHLRRAPGAAGRSAQGVHPQPRRGPRRRDARVAARPRQGQDEEGLRVGVSHDQLRVLRRQRPRGLLRLLQLAAPASICGACWATSAPHWSPTTTRDITPRTEVA